MSSPIDDKELEEYLSGGSEVSRRYRSIAGEEPPSDLDRAVLGHAHAAVQSSTTKVVRLPRRNTVRRMAPFAVAATVILSFAIVHETGVREPAVEMDIAAPETTAPPMAPMKVESFEERESAAPAPAAAPKEAAPQSSPPPHAAAPAAVLIHSRAALSDAPQEMTVRDRSEVKAVAEPLAPEVWLENIRKLRTQGQPVEADAELKRFLETYPQYFDKHPGVVRP